jgi:hypothetical protein
MATRKPIGVTAPAFPAEKGIALLRQQLEVLGQFKGKRHSEVQSAEKEWQHLTGSIVQKSFDSASTNRMKFETALYSGGHLQQSDFGRRQIDSRQPAFESRINALEPLLKGMIKELELCLPTDEIKGVYESGEEYAFYRDLSSLIVTAAKDVFIIDTYLNEKVFNLYVDKVPRGVTIRILSNNIGANVELVARMYAKSGPLQLRSSGDIHDRAIFLDQRGWVIGQSIKDAARAKPTYMIQLDEPLLAASRDVHQDLWTAATSII